MQASGLLERQLARLGAQYIPEYAAAATPGMYNYVQKYLYSGRQAHVHTRIPVQIPAKKRILVQTVQNKMKMDERLGRPKSHVRQMH